MYRLSIATRLILSLSLVVGAYAPARGLGAEGWLTQPERDFFAAQGLQGKVAGKAIERPENLKAFPEIAQRAPSPLQQRILADIGFHQGGQTIHYLEKRLTEQKEKSISMA